MPPKTLFKYQAVTCETLSNLKAHALWFSKPKHFNDPFDCNMLPPFKDNAESSTSTSQGSNMLEQARATARNEWGVACFSEVHSATWQNINNILLWSHYAAGHQGFCLEFDTTYDPFPHALDVHYLTEVPAIHLSSIESQDDDFKRVMFFTKAECWNYELEWRILDQTGDKQQKYDPKCLKALYFGTAMKPECRDEVRKILKDSPHTEIWELPKRDSYYWFLPKKVE